jgi:hypothetical protein
LLRFRSEVVDVTYHSVQQQHLEQQDQQLQDPKQQQLEEAHVVVEVAAVVSQPEQLDTTHTNTFRWA